MKFPVLMVEVKPAPSRLFIWNFMINKKVEILAHADWRWVFLCFIALVLAAGDLVALHDGIVDSGSARQKPEGWEDLDLHWENNGPRGQGVYARHANDRGEVERINIERAVAESQTEPRLAVFTFSSMDINRIDLETLQTLKGVGPKLAAAIIAHRRARGPFGTIEELLAVKGVGQAKFRLLASSLVVVDPGNR